MRADTKTAYIYQFQLYTGKNDGDGAGLASRVVKQLTNSLKNTSTHVAFDNFFSSVKLLEELRADKIFATGQCAQIAWNCPLWQRRRHQWTEVDQSG